MGTVRVKLNINGIRETLKSGGVQSELARRAQRIAATAGDGFQAVVKPHKYTARAFVWSTTAEAAKEEAENKTLTRALDAGR